MKNPERKRNNLDRIHEDEKIEKSLGQETPNSENDSPCQRTMPDSMPCQKAGTAVQFPAPRGLWIRMRRGWPTNPPTPFAADCPALLQRGLLANLEEGRGGSLFSPSPFPRLIPFLLSSPPPCPSSRPLSFSLSPLQPTNHEI